MISDAVSAIGDLVDRGIEQVSGLVENAHQQAASDPCYAEVQTRTAFARNMRPVTNQAIRAANARAVAGPAAVAAAINNRGRSSSRYAGGVTWARWVRENAINDSQIIGVAALLGGPIGAAIAVGGVEDWIAQALPPGAPSSSTSGLQISDGVYVYRGTPGTAAQHLASGTLSGPALVQAWDNWTAHEAATVYPPRFPQWRADLAALTGSETWQPGDDVAPQSMIGRQLAWEQEVLALADEAGEACALQREQQWDLARTTAQAWVDRQRAEGAATVLQGTAPLAAVVIGGIILGRSLKR